MTTIAIIGSGHVGSNLAKAAIAHGPLAGKVVIATINYFPQRDGHYPELDSGAATVPGRGGRAARTRG